MIHFFQEEEEERDFEYGEQLGVMDEEEEEEECCEYECVPLKSIFAAGGGAGERRGRIDSVEDEDDMEKGGNG